MSASLVCFRSAARVDLGARAAGPEIGARPDGMKTGGRGRLRVGIPRSGLAGAADGEARGPGPVGRRPLDSPRSPATPRSWGSYPSWGRARSTRTTVDCPGCDRTSRLPRFTSRSRGPTVCKRRPDLPLHKEFRLHRNPARREPYAFGVSRVGLPGQYVGGSDPVPAGSLAGNPCWLRLRGRTIRLS